MTKKIAAIITFTFLLTFSGFLTMGGVYHRSIEWNKLEEMSISDSLKMFIASFSGSHYRMSSNGLPEYAEAISLPAGTNTFRASIANVVYDVAPDGYEMLEGIAMQGGSPEIYFSTSFERKQPFALVSFVPLRINPYNGQVEIVKSFDILIDIDEGNRSVTETSGSYASNSILASGDWYKIWVSEDGIYRITYEDLRSIGIDPASVDPRNLRLYGNGGGMLAESLAEYRQDDLIENRIYISGENDGRFDAQDYILFYGQSPHQWEFQSFNQAFLHKQNIYSDSTCYFLTADLGPGKRVGVMPSLIEPPDVYISKFTDYKFHEQDLHNLANIGRVWYGEVFDVTTTYDFGFEFPNIDLGSQAYFRTYVAAKSEVTTNFTFSEGGQQILSANISGIPASASTEARSYIGSNWFTPSSSLINVRAVYQKVISSSLGWLNYIELNVTRNLVFSGSQLSFRDPFSVTPGTIAEFELQNAGSAVQIWNVTDPANVLKMETLSSGGRQTFRVAQDTMQEFIAFDGSAYLQVNVIGKIDNQDLHGAGPHDMIIITHPLFRDQAERLAAFHESHDGLSVFVTDIGKVYNEFSSGVQDITAIRNFMKMLYDKASPGEEPRYLLLFGDASFDYKDRIDDNSNFVPTWEDDESLVIVYSIASDDYYGFLDGPGDNMLDIGIGRMPVQTIEQATVAVDKVIHYATNSPIVMKEWRNFLCFVADDEDGNLHLRQAEEMAAYIDTNYGVYNVDKIYVDAFPQVSTPGGQRAPEVNLAINDRIDKGCLIMNYTGHGGEVGWGHERFLENSDINAWTNYDYMPIFITATCEFSRYDDPERTSAGEYAYLNPEGGAIAMFTTARATFGGSNFNLNTALFEYMFEMQNGEHYRFGDLIRLSKNKGGVDGNDKKFILLGDPALQLAYPEHEIITTRINETDVSTMPDTLQALGRITIEGEVRMNNGSGETFNGTVYPIVFDKASQITTLAPDDTSYESVFELQNNILYKGKAQVKDGKFSFTFIVPKDIAYQYGFGKISYYAANDEQDAHGFYRNILVGGLDQSAGVDVQGPEVQLFMNNEYFTFGGITDENPDMLAFVNDESGINTVGTGIGHDIVAILDGETDKPIILNDFYEADLDSYTHGTIRYPFHNLEEGRHTLSLKVWDVFNNSGEAYLEFNVVRSDKFIINEVLNYPNPFNNGTSFVFSHNQAEGRLDVRLRVFDLSGRVVMSTEENIQLTGYRSEAIYWDGTGDGGAPLARGLYIYRISARNEEGQTDEKTGKLVMIDN